MGFREAQLFHDVVRDARCGRGRESQHGDAGNPLAQLGDPQVGGPEIVAPLGDAVGLIDGEKRYVHSLHPQAEGLGCEPFGSDVEEFHVAIGTQLSRSMSICRADRPEWIARARMPSLRSRSTWSFIRAISGVTTMHTPSEASPGI